MMMKNTVIIILALFMGFAACKKDEETEPSKEDLLCKKWNIEKYTFDGNNLEYMTAFAWEFTKDGYLINTSITTGLSDTTNWNWGENQNNIEIESFDKNFKFIKSTQSKFYFNIRLLTTTNLSLESIDEEYVTIIEFIN